MSECCVCGYADDYDEWVQQASDTRLAVLGVWSGVPADCPVSTAAAVDAIGEERDELRRSLLDMCDHLYAMLGRQTATSSAARVLAERKN